MLDFPLKNLKPKGCRPRSPPSHWPEPKEKGTPKQRRLQQANDPKVMLNSGNPLKRPGKKPLSSPCSNSLRMKVPVMAWRNIEHDMYIHSLKVVSSQKLQLRRNSAVELASASNILFVKANTCLFAANLESSLQKHTNTSWDIFRNILEI